MRIFKGNKGRGIIVALAMMCYLIASAAGSVDFHRVSTTIDSTKYSQHVEEDTAGKQSALVDYDADIMTNRGDEIIRLIGNVHFHHKGTIIQCDSALQYPDDRMEFFSRVIIEKDSALIYGDRVYYDGNTRLADVFAPIVKMTRGEATLYSYNLQFNTETSVGYFHDGGVLSQKENLIEATKGYFDAENNYVKFKENVAARNETYTIKTDSMGFNIDAEQLDFLTKTYIWDGDKDFLRADGGHYFSSTKSYLFYKDAYVLTPDNEMWADTLRYLTESRQAYLFSNVQILDSTNTTVAFGDWGFYDDSLERAILTHKPSVRAWDTKEDENNKEVRDDKAKFDTTYMRADTIILVTLFPVVESDTASIADSLALMPLDSMLLDSMTVKADSVIYEDTFSPDEAVQSVHNSSVPTVLDTLVQSKDSLTIDSLNSYSTRALLDTTSLALLVTDSVRSDILLKEIIKPNSLITDSLVLDSIVLDSIVLDSIVLDSIVLDSLVLDSLALDSLALDSLALDSLVLDSLALDSLTVDTLQTPKEPPVPRLIKAYHNMRMWSKEFQAKCDSVVAYTVDSTMVMFGLPVMWNENNQITSEKVELYTKNENLDWAYLSGNPFICQQLFHDDTLLVNQATGKELEVYFTNNELDFTIMKGNVQNLYYMTEKNKVNALVSIESAELTMIFVKREPAKMIWSGNGSGPIYPMDQIPSDQPRYLPGFTWQEDIRPKNAVEISPRNEKPSEKKQSQTIDKPIFAIDIKMRRNMRINTEKGVWSDRTEWPDVTPEYFEKTNDKIFF